jgi:uncharacterized cupredoxin-like copper-binding protein
MLPYVGLVVLLLGAVALAACGGGGGGASKPAGGGAATITMRGTDAMRFEPSSITARANTPTTLTLNDAGAALIHDWTVDNLGGQKVQVVVQPNSQGSVQFTAPAAGAFPFYCSQPGHREAGMTGTLTVIN